MSCSTSTNVLSPAQIELNHFETMTNEEKAAENVQQKAERSDRIKELLEIVECEDFLLQHDSLVTQTKEAEALRTTNQDQSAQANKREPEPPIPSVSTLDRPLMPNRRSDLGRLNAFEAGLVLLLRQNDAELKESHTKLVMENMELKFELERERYKVRHWSGYAGVLLDALQEYEIPTPVGHGYYEGERGYAAEDNDNN
ncbi:hypothetical protein V5O48_003673 [Marasmius crinis-equi]|uniref:Uncharacterized protein n=1 Tax=Marasmius crinis-equi TaxID=585013 RepID=A0ABR3FS93_9AGAR